MTDVGTTKRKAMSPTRRLRIFEAHKGVCILCNSKIDGVRERWFIEHNRALGLGGEDDDGNCGPAHYACKPEKDSDDMQRIAKAKRVKQIHLGIKSSKQAIKSAGFPKTEKAAKREPKPSLPPRPLYQERQS